MAKAKTKAEEAAKTKPGTTAVAKEKKLAKSLRTGSHSTVTSKKNAGKSSQKTGTSAKKIDKSGKTKAKTTETSASVEGFLNTVLDDVKKKSCFDIIEIFESASGFEPKMWGPAIVGFGSYHYKYATGHEGDAPVIGFSPRKNAIVLYLSSSFVGRDELLGKLGKYKTGKSCIYIQHFDQVDKKILKEMVRRSVKHTMTASAAGNFSESC